MKRFDNLSLNEPVRFSKIAVNKNLCKEFNTNHCDRTVYLKDGDEFQIQLFNHKQVTIGVEIYINDQKLDNKIVVRPGQRIWLERYLDSPKKFKFSTYEVDSSEDALEAISKNGNIEIKIFEEKAAYEFEPFHNLRINKDLKINKDYDDWNHRISWDNHNFNTFETKLTCDTSVNNLYSLVSDVNLKFDTPRCTVDNAIQTSNLIETGRIEKGSHSNQKFSEVDIDFETFASYTEKIKLVPVSQKPVFANDLEKIYCTECGRKLKTKYKFCPYCGNKIE